MNIGKPGSLLTPWSCPYTYMYPHEKVRRISAGKVKNEKPKKIWYAERRRLSIIDILQERQMLEIQESRQHKSVMKLI